MAKLQDLSPVYQRINTGIRVGVYPSSDPQCAIELHRSVAGSTATFTLLTRFSQVAGQGILQYDDRLPDDGVTRYYKAKSLRDGYTDSTFTATVTAKPAILLFNQIATPPLSGQALTIGFHLSTGALLNFGNAGAPTAYKKTVRFSATHFVAKNSVETWQYAAAVGLAIAPTAAGQQDFFCPVRLPVGATITGVAIHHYRTKSSATCQTKLHKRSTDSGTTIVFTKSHSTASGWETSNSSTLNEVVTAGVDFVLETNLSAPATSAAGVRMSWCDVSYTVSHVGASL